MSYPLNILKNLPDALKSEHFQPLFKKDGLLIERIVSQGQTTPDGEWYDQSWDEWVLLLVGNAEILIEGDAKPLQLVPGDSILLPAGCRHRVTKTDSTQPTVWLAVHHGKPL